MEIEPKTLVSSFLQRRTQYILPVIVESAQQQALIAVEQPFPTVAKRNSWPFLHTNKNWLSYVRMHAEMILRSSRTNINFCMKRYFSIIIIPCISTEI